MVFHRYYLDLSVYLLYRPGVDPRSFQDLEYAPFERVFRKTIFGVEKLNRFVRRE